MEGEECENKEREESRKGGISEIRNKRKNPEEDWMRERTGRKGGETEIKESTSREKRRRGGMRGGRKRRWRGQQMLSSRS